MRHTFLFVGFLTVLFTTTTAPAMAQAAIPEPEEYFNLATVVRIIEAHEQQAGDVKEYAQLLRMRMKDGPEAGSEFGMDHITPLHRENMRLKPGQTVIVQTILKTDGTTEYVMKEAYRLPALFWLFVLFLLLAFLLGGRTSVMAVGGLLVSLAIILLIILPRIMAGDNPMLVSLLGCALIACTSLYLAHGFNKRTSVALLSTLLTLGLSAIIALIFVYVGKLFGLGSEEAMFLQLGQLQMIDLRGLLLGGILIGCLGVLDDITTAQTAAIDEIRKANPSLSPAKLREAGRSVGKEHIASLINTLALAYIGASLPLLLLFHIQTDFPLWVTLNGEFLAEEIVRTLVGSATLLFAVPLSTWCASILLTGKRNDTARQSHMHSHHHHA